MYEIEAKVRIDDLAAVRKRLAEHNAIPACEESQIDVYYNAPHRDFAATDEALRVRYAGDGPEITYKGPRLASSGMKARREITVGVDSGERFEEVLAFLGFSRVAAVVKRREEYHWQGATIALDSVEGLGNFVEIEVMTEGDRDAAQAHIHELERMLEVQGTHITDSYLELIMAKR
ncbi:MAG TPA: class IV adenylate cyclase [Methanoculleus sp.]|nr:class IV adenylate cyclase [Methanoculleus sp.]